MFFGGGLVENLGILTEKLPFWRNVGWSVYVALASTALTLLFCSMGGYAFARLEFPAKKALFAFVMATMLLPSFMNMIPTFMVMDALGWIDEHRALYIPGAASAFGIFLVRQFASTAIPPELIEAARMTVAANGASTGASLCRCCGRRWARWGWSPSSARGTTSWRRWW